MITENFFKTILQLQGSVSSGDGGMVFVLATLTMMVTWILSSQTTDQIPNTNLKESISLFVYSMVILMEQDNQPLLKLNTKMMFFFQSEEGAARHTPCRFFWINSIPLTASQEPPCRKSIPHKNLMTPRFIRRLNFDQESFLMMVLVNLSSVPYRA